MNIKLTLIFLISIVLTIMLSFNSEISLVNATNHTQTNTSYGNLYVQTIPTEANVYIDGSFKGLSPVTVPNLYIGYAHTVKATKQGYQDTSTTVTLVADQTTSIYLTLQQLDKQGSIYVTTSPTAANIYLDGTLKGISPLSIFNVTVGNHTVRASKSGYQDASTLVNVLLNQQSIVSLVLQPLNASQSVGSLSVTTIPSNVAIYLDGVFKGITQFGTLNINNIPVGSHTVLGRKSGYQDSSSTVIIYAGLITKLTLNLQPFTLTCTDSDNGINYYVQGTAILTRSDGNVTQRATDFCSSTKTLNEYSCSPSGNSISVNLYTCQGKCKFGACKLQSNQILPLSATNILVLLALILIAAFFIVRNKQGKATKLKQKRSRK